MRVVRQSAADPTGAERTLSQVFSRLSRPPSTLAGLSKLPTTPVAHASAPLTALPPRRGRARLLEGANTVAARIVASLKAPRSGLQVVIWLSLWLAVCLNWRLWSDLASVGGAPSVYLPLICKVAVLIFCANLATLSVTAWDRWMKPLWILVLLSAAVMQHYMLAYRVVMDTSMLANALQTDPSEVRDLVSWSLVGSVLVVAGPPIVWLVCADLKPRPFLVQARRALGLLAISLVALFGSGLILYREIVPLLRAHQQLRYVINPLAGFTALAVLELKPVFGRSKRLVPISAGAALGPTHAAGMRPPLLVLVIGETARGDHFGINGYARDTTPQIATRNVVSFHEVRSCGTNTIDSVPCMFSHLGHADYTGSKVTYENLLDVLQAAGLGVFWLDNQAGCKSVCRRIANASTARDDRRVGDQTLCADGECLDEVMLGELDARLAEQPPERRRNGVVLVLHVMGSHGPAYSKRSPPRAKRFLPECTTTALASCRHTELMNVYDNTIAYTDEFLARTIDWLKTKSARYDTKLLYLSDHGESLGEYGLFLHGIPYRLAPDVQKQVAMILWPGGSASTQRALSGECLRAKVDQPLTHDNMYHTVLGLVDVTTPTYRPALDITAGCWSAAH